MRLALAPEHRAGVDELGHMDAPLRPHQDVAAIIAYESRLAPAAGPASEVRLSLPVKALYVIAVSPVMPFHSLREMSDIDVRALYLHLKSTPVPS